MNEMVERVAKAMAKADADNPAWKMYVREARAALEALREPTVEMLVAAQEEWMCVRAAEERGDFIWRAMIDAALSEGPR